MRKVNSHRGTSASGAIHYSIKQELCQICPSKMSCLGKSPRFCYITLQQMTQQRQDGYSRCWTFPTDIWTPISRLLETEAKDVALDPKVHLAVSPKLLQASPSAVLDKAGSLERTRLGQVLRTNSEAVVVAICRCLPPPKRLMKIKAWPSVSIMQSWKISHHSSCNDKESKPKATKGTVILCTGFTVCKGMLSCWSVLTRQGMSFPCAVKLFPSWLS